MKASTKKYLLWAGGLYAAYYWYKNYGPGATTTATPSQVAANPAAQAIGQAAMATQNAIYTAASQMGQ
jgi:hypothetical protein